MRGAAVHPLPQNMYANTTMGAGYVSNHPGPVSAELRGHCLFGHLSVGGGSAGSPALLLRQYGAGLPVQQCQSHRLPGGAHAPQKVTQGCSGCPGQQPGLFIPDPRAHSGPAKARAGQLGPLDVPENRLRGDAGKPQNENCRAWGPRFQRSLHLGDHHPKRVWRLQLPASAGSKHPRPSADGSLSVEGQPDVQYFNAAVPVTNGVYGLYLSRSNGDIGERSTQTVQVPIFNSLGFPMGFVELSESPAYGREIVSSVASGLALAGGLAILLAIGVGWLTSRRLTAPLLRLTQATRQMSGGDLSVRVLEAERGDEFGMLGKSFNHMAARIEETVQTLRRFLADAAHELQTPLTALRTNLELARSEDNRLPAENYLTQALEQLDRLQRLLTDLLSLSRLESAAGPEDFQPVDLKVLIQQVSEPYAARAEQAGQVFELHLPTSDPQVSGSPEKLRSALANLLDNALKFTPTGGAVRVRLDETPDSLCVTVSDTGIGIPPAEIDMLYNRFHRARNASAYPGSGLGLAIVRAIAQAHGGSVQAGNNPHGGATFTLRLPHPANPNANCNPHAAAYAILTPSSSCSPGIPARFFRCH